MQYGNVSQLSAGMLFGAQVAARTEPFVAQETLKFGMGAFGYYGVKDKAYNLHNDKIVVTYSADFTAANATAINLTVNGLAIEPVVYTTSHAATIALLVLAVQALNSDWIVSASGRILTIVTPGETATCTGAVTGATPPTTTPVISMSTDMVFLGPVLKAQKAPSEIALSDEAYTDGEDFEVLVEGQMAVVVDDISLVSVYKPVYMIKTGDDAGKFTATVGSNLAINATFDFVADAAQNIAVIRLDNFKKAVG